MVKFTKSEVIQGIRVYLDLLLRGEISRYAFEHQLADHVIELMKITEPQGGSTK